ncbi:MAG: preprotein translocase subunit YajC [Oscillospiraceae bacterium]|nr:preprotein translocase subunit YajC [Oscillospiraceae bacterium]
MGMLIGTVGPIVLMFVIFYFLLIRPQKKREQEVQKMREAIEVGDEIVTIGGIIGRVVSIKEDTLVIETSAERSKLRMARWSIQQNNTAAERANAAKKEAAKEEKK